jgi:hypothetical protein
MQVSTRRNAHICGTMRMHSTTHSSRQTATTLGCCSCITSVRSNYLQIIPARLELGAEVPEELAVREVIKCVQLGVGQQAYLLDVVGEGAVAGACAVFYVRLSAYTVSIGKGRERW